MCWHPALNPINHAITQLPITTCPSWLPTQLGPLLLLSNPLIYYTALMDVRSGNQA